jgi:hypothetical protein
LYRLGICTAEAGQWPASQKHYEALLAQFPEFELIQEARHGLGWAVQNQGKFDDAVKRLSASRRLSRSFPSIRGPRMRLCRLPT